MDEKKVGSVERVRLALEEKGVDSEIERFDQSTRTATDAAAAIGCSVGQIAKSLIFRAPALFSNICLLSGEIQFGCKAKCLC